MELLLLILLGIILTPLALIWRGWVLTKLWAWFVVPVFGLPALGIATAIGLSVVVGYLVYHMDDSVKVEREKWAAFGYPVSVMFLHPAIALGIGWMVTLFM